MFPFFLLSRLATWCLGATGPLFFAFTPSALCPLPRPALRLRWPFFYGCLLVGGPAAPNPTAAPPLPPGREWAYSERGPCRRSLWAASRPGPSPPPPSGRRRNKNPSGRDRRGGWLSQMCQLLEVGERGMLSLAWAAAEASIPPPHPPSRGVLKAQEAFATSRPFLLSEASRPPNLDPGRPNPALGVSKRLTWHPTVAEEP